MGCLHQLDRLFVKGSRVEPLIQRPVFVAGRVNLPIQINSSYASTLRYRILENLVKLVFSYFHRHFCLLMATV